MEQRAKFLAKINLNKACNRYETFHNNENVNFEEQRDVQRSF